MTLQFNSVRRLQTIFSCPSCDKEGREAGFADCCFRFALMCLGIQDRRKCPLCGEGFVTDNDEIGCPPGYCSSNAVPVGEVLRDGEGYCYAVDQCNEEFCKGYIPYNRELRECLHYSSDGRCALP